MRSRDGKLRACVFACAALIFAVLARSLVVGKVHVFGDLLEQQVPMRWFYAQCLRAGTSFAWCPFLYCGFHFAGEGQCGPFHPLHLLMFRIVPFWQAVELDALWPYPVAFAGAYLWLRRWVGRDGAAFGALCFAFAGLNVLHFHHNSVTAAAAHLPWLLFCGDLALRGRRPKTVAWGRFGLTLCTASQILVGHHYLIWISALIELAVAVWVVRTTAGARGRLLGVLLAKLLGVAGAGVQLAATLDYYRASARAFPAEWARNEFAVTPSRLMSLVAPYAFADRLTDQPAYEETSLYLGATPLLLAAWYLAHGAPRPAERRMGRALAVLFAVGLLLAMGSRGGLYELLRLIPVIRSFRCPGRYFFAGQLAVAVAAGAALRLLCRPAPETRDEVRGRCVVTGLVIASWAAAAAILAMRSAAYTEAWRVLLGPVLLSAGGWLVLRAARLGRGGLVPLVVFTALDLLVYAAGSPPHRFLATPAAVLAGAPRPPDGDTCRFIGGSADRCLFSGARQMDGYSGFPPAKRLDYTLPATWAAASVAAVRLDPSPQGFSGLDLQTLNLWLVWQRGLAVHYALRSAATDLWQRGEAVDGWLRLRAPLPRVRLLSHAVVSGDPVRDLPGIDLRTTGLVEQPLALTAGAPGAVAVIDERPGALRVATAAPARRLLTVGESWHRGWRVAVDGRPAQVWRVNGDFLGCVVEAGRQQVAFDFRDPTRPAGLAWSVIGLALAAAWLAIGRRRR